jgi:hypothetical protein
MQLASFSKTSGLQDLTRVLSQPCLCETDPWFMDSGFVDSSCQHVITCSPNVLKDCPHPDIKKLFSFGTSHRPLTGRLCMSAAARQTILMTVADALSVFVTKYNISPHGANHCLVQWRHHVLALLQARLQSPAFADGQFFDTATKPHAFGTEFVPYLPEFDRYVRQHVHTHFIVTTADKLSKDYVFVCRKYYVHTADAGRFEPPAIFMLLCSLRPVLHHSALLWMICCVLSTLLPRVCFHGCKMNLTCVCSCQPCLMLRLWSSCTNIQWPSVFLHAVVPILCGPLPYG